MYLINKKHVKDFALGISRNNGRKFTRVSGQFLNRMNGRLAAVIADEVHRHPSLGITLK
jgi:hypothetical protein